MLLKACINGARRREEHPRLPLSPDEQARAAADAVRAGANAIHAHVRNANGDESLDERDVALLVAAMRASCPATPIGVSTGAWILPDPALRARTIAQWTTLPDFASVNFSEEGAAEVARILLAAGVAVEAGLTEARDAALFVASGLAPACLRVLLEPQSQDLATALAAVNAMEAALAALPLPRLLHGFDATAWPLFDEAALRGYDARIGLEDTLVLRDGARAADTAELVRAVVRR